MGANDKMTPHDYAQAKALVVELQRENAQLQERYENLQRHWKDAERRILEAQQGNQEQHDRAEALKVALESAQATICGEFCVGDSHAPACVAIDRARGGR